METSNVEKVEQKPSKPYQIQKGQVLAGGGRPKGSLSMTTLIRHALIKLNKGETLTPAEKISMSLIRQAEVGDLKAIEMVLDRVDGKPTQTNQNLNININDPLKPEQQERLLKILEQ